LLGVSRRHPEQQFLLFTAASTSSVEQLLSCAACGKHKKLQAAMLCQTSQLHFN